MSVFTLPTVADNMVHFEFPIPGRTTPITVDCPKLNWMPPKNVKVWSEWLKPLAEAENRVAEWNDRNAGLSTDLREPAPAEDLKVIEGFDQRELTGLRWLKQFCSAADYKTIVDNAPMAWAVLVRKQIDPTYETPADGLDDIDLGESSASTDS